MVYLKFVSAALITLGLLPQAKAVTCAFNEGGVTYTVELEPSVKAVVMYSGGGHELPFYGTGNGNFSGARAYMDRAGRQLYVWDRTFPLTLTLWNAPTGSYLFTNKVCHPDSAPQTYAPPAYAPPTSTTPSALDPVVVRSQIERLISNDQVVRGIVEVVQTQRQMRCELSPGTTRLTSRLEDSYDNGARFASSDFVASFMCRDLKFNSMAGTMEFTGRFDGTRNTLQLKNISLGSPGY